MKKKYVKPRTIVEEFAPQQVLCTCAVVNNLMSEYVQCAYWLDGTDLMLFAQTWSSCMADPTFYGYCYQPGTTANTVFSS